MCAQCLLQFGVAIMSLCVCDSVMCCSTPAISCRFVSLTKVHLCRQNKVKRVETKEAVAEGVKDDPSAPDTGQNALGATSPSSPEELAATAGISAAPNNNNSNSNYNLVSSLLNLTKSPVSGTPLPSSMAPNNETAIKTTIKILASRDLRFFYFSRRKFVFKVHTACT